MRSLRLLFAFLVIGSMFGISGALVLIFIVGPLLENPHRVGKPLRAPLEGCHSARRGTYRVIYRIDDVERRVTVVGVLPRSDACRPH